MRSHVWTYQIGQLPLDHVRLDEPRRKCVLAFLLVLDLDGAVLPDAFAERRHELLLGPRRTRLGRLAEVELAEGLLELLADALERRVRVGRDHRADELECEPDRARLERRQPGR